MKEVPSKPKKNFSDDKTADHPDIRDVTLDAGLYIVSTPIGNLRDITLRALDVLAGCDVVLSEDKRVTQKLLNAYGLKPSMMVYHEHNGEKQRPKILSRLEKDEAVALVTDAGTPAISDPGFKLVREVRRAGYNVIPIPGASAVLCALVGSTLPTDRFLFAGFLPPKKAARQSKLSALAQSDVTLVFYESPRRTKAFMQDIYAVMGNRDVVIAREMTKKFEEFMYGTADNILNRLQDKELKGEVVIMIGPPGKNADPEYNDAALDKLLDKALSDMGLSVRDAAAYVAEQTGVQKRKLYARALALNHAGRSDVNF